MKIKTKLYAAIAVIAGICSFSISSDSGSLSVRSSSDSLTLVSSQTFNDDVLLQFGSGGTVHCLYETADANANLLLCAAPEGGGTDVPGFVWGDASAENVDLGFFNGLTFPFIGILSDDNLSYTYLAHDQANSVIANNEGDLIVNLAGGNLAPSANDGAALGISGTGWSDAFLASGAIIDFAAGDVALTHASNNLSFAGGNYNFTQPVFTSGSPVGLEFIGGAHTTLAASAEATDVTFNLARTVQFATGALPSQRAVVINAPTYGFAGPSTITNASTLAITGAPQQGANATIDETAGLLIQSSGYASDEAHSAIIGMPGISNGTGNVDHRAALNISGVGNPISLGNQTATLTDLVGLSVDSNTYESTTNVRTITNGVGVKISPPVSGSNVRMTTVAAGVFGDNTTQVSAADFNYSDVATGGSTLTLTGSTGVTSVPGVSSVNVGQITVTDDSAVTVDLAASVYIENAPVAAGSAVLTNSYSLWVDAGISRFDGTLNATGGGALTGTWSDLGK